MCHALPTIGGSSPGLASPQNPVMNPQVALAGLDDATNVVPSFITADGPVREARFVRNADGSLDGGVHDSSLEGKLASGSDNVFGSRHSIPSRKSGEQSGEQKLPNESVFTQFRHVPPACKPLR